jgi:hypothetical protein
VRYVLAVALASLVATAANAQQPTCILQAIEEEARRTGAQDFINKCAADVQGVCESLAAQRVGRARKVSSSTTTSLSTLGRIIRETTIWLPRQHPRRLMRRPFARSHREFSFRFGVGRAKTRKQAARAAGLAAYYFLKSWST